MYSPDLCTDDKKRLVLDEFYTMWLPLYERKIERIREFLAQVRSPEVDFASLMRNSLIDEDGLQRLLDDYELIVP